MATVLEDVGKRTISELDYVGSLNIHREFEHSVVGDAARDRQRVAICREPLSVAGIRAPNAGDRR